MKRASLTLIAIAGLFAGVASCAGQADKAPIGTGSGGAGAPLPCSTAGQCPGTAACVTNVCVPRTTVEAAWAIEIRPPASSMTAALTELPTVAATGTTLALDAVDKVRAEIVVNSANTGLTSAGSIIASVPSLIPGQPALTFEAAVGATMSTNGCTRSACASLVIPQTVLDRPGTTIVLVPAPPTDQQSPPFSFPDMVLASLVTLPIPPTLVTLRGKVSTALGDPPPLNLFAARAFQDETAVSNAATVDKDGNFALFVPPAVASRSYSRPITLQLTPQAAGSSAPWFTMDPFVVIGTTFDIDPITLAPYPNADVPGNIPFLYAIKAGGTDVTVQGALVRAATKLEPQARGVTRFVRDGFTDTDGLVGLTLIPGSASAPRSYDISVVPPAGSPYATQCLPRQPIVTGSGTAVDIVLVPRPVVSGAVTTASGAGAVGVTVRATRQSAPVNDCGTYGPGSTDTITDAQGKYTLALDPGFYQIDYDPPSGAPLPRLTELDIQVMSDLPHTVHLPAAALVEGDVHDSAGPVSYATISILEPVCGPTDICLFAPTLLARTQTDMDGHFRAIVPKN